ncbi:MAG: tetratricopeptide repeat protein [bacterium]
MDLETVKEILLDETKDAEDVKRLLRGDAEAKPHLTEGEPVATQEAEAPRLEVAAGKEYAADAVGEALKEAVSEESLKAVFGGGERVVIVFKPMRGVRNDLILSGLIDRLSGAGVPEENVGIALAGVRGGDVGDVVGEDVRRWFEVGICDGEGLLGLDRRGVSDGVLVDKGVLRADRVLVLSVEREGKGFKGAVASPEGGSYEPPDLVLKAIVNRRGELVAFRAQSPSTPAEPEPPAVEGEIVPPEITLKGKVSEAVSEESLKAVFGGGERVVIVFKPMRGVRNDLILSGLIDRLSGAGVPEENVGIALAGVRGGDVGDVVGEDVRRWFEVGICDGEGLLGLDRRGVSDGVLVDKGVLRADRVLVLSVEREGKGFKGVVVSPEGGSYESPDLVLKAIVNRKREFTDLLVRFPLIEEKKEEIAAEVSEGTPIAVGVGKIQYVSVSVWATIKSFFVHVGEEDVGERRHRGFVIPLFINVFVVVFLAVGVFISYRITHREGEVTPLKPEFAAGSVAVEVIADIQAQRKAVEEELTAQQAKVQEAEGKIKELENTRQEWIFQQEQLIAQREKEIKDEYQRRLEEEIARIRAGGGVDVEARIAEARRKSEEERARALEDARRQAQQEIARYEAEYRRNLAAAQAQLDRQRAEFEQQKSVLDKRIAELQKQAEEAERQIKEAEAREAQRAAFATQAGSIYGRAIDAYMRRDYETASKEFRNALRLLELSEGVEGKGTKDYEKFMVERMLSLIAMESTAQTTKLAKNEDRVKIETLYGEAATAYENKDFDRASSKFKELLFVIPQVSLTSERIAEIEKLKSNQLAKKKLDLADSLAVKGDYAAAKKEYEEIILSYPKSDYVDEALLGINSMNSRLIEATEALDEEAINRKAAARYEEANRLFAGGNYGEAKKVYEDVIISYPKSDYVDRALEGVNKSVDKINELERKLQNEAAGKEFAEAEALEKAGNFEGAKEKYKKIVTSYPLSDYIDRSLGGINRADEGIALRDKRVLNAKAQDALAAADLLLDRGRYAEAKESYRALIRDYPGSDYVDEALEGIRRAEAAIERAKTEEEITEAVKVIEKRSQEVGHILRIVEPDRVYVKMRGVKERDRLSVYRGGKVIASLVVQRVYDSLVAEAKIVSFEEPLRVNDVVQVAVE